MATKIQLLLRHSTGKKRRRPRRPVFPTGQVIAYQREVRRAIEALRQSVNRILVPALPGLLAKASPLRPKTDDFNDDLEGLLDAVLASYGREVPEEKVRQIVETRARDVEGFNRRDVGRTMASILGVDPIGSEPWLSTERDLFSAQNVALIHDDVPSQAKDRIRTAVNEAARRGTRASDVAEEVLKIVDVSESRAMLIARDQISKYNGDLTRLRQTDAGFAKYRWRTAGDERVRDTHASKEGEIYEWADPPADTGAPGEDYQCRCVAEPVLPEDATE